MKLHGDYIIQELQDYCFDKACLAGWWDNNTTMLYEDYLKMMVPIKLCLIHSEISEAMEADRKNLMDDKLPHRKGIEVELADAIIRIMDLGGALDLDLQGAIQEKMIFNSTREDHKPENRVKENGKSY